MADGRGRAGWDVRRRMEVTVAGRPRWMGWLVVVEADRGGVAVVDGGSSDGRRRRWRMEVEESGCDGRR